MIKLIFIYNIFSILFSLINDVMMHEWLEETVVQWEKVKELQQEISSEDVMEARRKALWKAEDILLIWKNFIPKDLLFPVSTSSDSLHVKDNIYWKEQQK